MTRNIIPIERDITSLKTDHFDVLVAGAGIFGAAAAWDAALRGYRVALIERDDFCSGVSANSYKVVHGGIRYIQHLDVPRVRSSCHERSTLFRIAPHLVNPLPIVIPTYGWGMSGKPVLAAGMYLYDLLTADRNRGISDAARRVPWTRLMSRAQALDRFPGLPDQGLTGATVFSDAQMYNPPRLVLGFIQAAAAKGACVANYVRLEGYETSAGRISAARVVDELSGERFDIRARVVLNAMGPWSDRLLERDENTTDILPGIYSRDACFVVKRQFDHDLSVALMAQTHDPDAFFSRPARHVFIVPWREYSLIGTWHKVVDPDPDKIGITEREIATFIDEIRQAYPPLDIGMDDVTMCYWGLVPFGEEQPDGKNLSYGKRSLIVDHDDHSGPSNLVTLVGIRYTMGRGDAALAMQKVAAKLKDSQKPPQTDEIPIRGGDVDDMQRLTDELRELLPAQCSSASADALARNHGSEAPGLLSSANDKDLSVLGSSHVLAAEVRHAIRNEMAQSLSDVVFRRTDLASGGHPGDTALDACARIVAEELGLSESEIDAQKAEVLSRIPGWTS